MRSNTVIQIKKSTVTDRPESLNIAELAYSFTSNTLFIGTSANSVINIGGYNIATAVENRTSSNVANTIVVRDSNGSFSASRVYASLWGNANTASKFETPRYINISGDVNTTSNLFDGTANAGFTLILNDTGINSGTYGGTRQIPVIKFYANGVAHFAGNTHIDTTLAFSGDYGYANVEVYNQVLNFAGGDGITTHVHDSNNEVTFEVDETVVKFEKEPIPSEYIKSLRSNVDPESGACERSNVIVAVSLAVTKLLSELIETVGPEPELPHPAPAVHVAGVVPSK